VPGRQSGGRQAPVKKTSEGNLFVGEQLLDFMLISWTTRPI
jgi:hypothetical protein